MKIYVSIFSIAMLLATAGLSFGQVVVDDFNRDNDPNLNNGWSEAVWYGEDVTNETPPILQMDPQLVNSQGQFLRIGVDDERVIAVVSRAISGVYEVSLDMKFSSANNARVDDARLGLTLVDESDNSISVLLGDNSTDPNIPYTQMVYIEYNGVHQEIKTTDDYREFNNYKIVVSDLGGLSIYFNDELQMQTVGGVFGTVTDVEIGATRWWRWHGFFFDNFLAVGDIETCEDVRLLGKTMDMDFDEDCYVGLGELAYMISDWLKCNVPYQAGCE